MFDQTPVNVDQSRRGRRLIHAALLAIAVVVVLACAVTPFYAVRYTSHGRPSLLLARGSITWGWSDDPLPESGLELGTVRTWRGVGPYIWLPQTGKSTIIGRDASGATYRTNVHYKTFPLWILLVAAVFAYVKHLVRSARRRSRALAQHSPVAVARPGHPDPPVIS